MFVFDFKINNSKKKSFTELEAEPKTYTHQRKRLFKIGQQEKQGLTGTKSFFGSFGRAKNKSRKYQDKSDSDNESVDETAEPAAVNSSNNNISAADQSIFADLDDNNQQIENEDSTKDVEKPTTAQTKDANTTNYGTMTIKLKRNEGSSPRLSLSINNIRFSEMMSEKDVEKTFRLTIEE